MLVEIYGDDLSPCIAEAYATELYADIFEDCCALDSVYATAYRLETEVFGEDCFSKGWYVFTGILALMENGEKTARRLYDCFLGFHDFSVLEKLLLENAEWLKEEELQKVIRLAEGVFDRQILRACLGSFFQGGDD